MKPGWIKLYKQTLDSDFWADAGPFDIRAAFIHVLLAANWRDGVSRRNGHKVIVKRGQWLTSIRKLADTFHWSRDRVYRWIKAMKDYGMLETENLKFGTLLTVVNYDVYQDEADIHKDTLKDTHEDTGEDTHKDTLKTRSKNIDIRHKTTDSISPADAGTPPADTNEPPMGTPEWYALHYDD